MPRWNETHPLSLFLFAVLGTVIHNMSVRWYDRMRVHSTREARAELAAAEARLAAHELKIRAEVEVAILAIDTTRTQAESATVAGKHAEESLRIERQKYALGRGTIPDVLEAEAALTRARAGYHMAAAAHRIAFEQLLYAMGERSTP